MTDSSDLPTHHDSAAETTRPRPAGAPSIDIRAGDRIGRYTVGARLGVGGMGEVFSVVDESLGRPVAAKVIRGRDDRRSEAKFVLEAQVTGQLEHPNIVPVHELGRGADGQLYFTMKKVQGRTFSEVLESLGGAPPSPDRLVELLRTLGKVCDAVAFAHSRDVIHRDLKPANIMVGDFGEVLVMDWGLAKVLGKPDPARSTVTLDLSALRAGGPDAELRTLDGDVVGTPAYMPPEQARGEIDRLDGRADIYSLGALLYHVVTGGPPYRGTIYDVLHQVSSAALTRPSAHGPVPWELEAVVLRAMDADPERRYASAAELRDELDRYLAGGLLRAARYSAAQRLGKWVARNRLVVGVVLAALVAGAGALGWARWQRRRALPGLLTTVREAEKAGRWTEALDGVSRILAIAPAHRGALEARGRLRMRAATATRRAARSEQARKAVAAAEALLAELPDLTAVEAAWTARQNAPLDGPPPLEDLALARLRAEALRVTLAAIGDVDRALALAPDHQTARTLRLRLGRELARVARLGGEYTLAEQAVRDLRRVGLSSTEVERELGRIASARTALTRRRRARVRAILADVPAVDRPDRAADAPTVKDYLIELIRYREQVTVDELERAGAPLVARARASKAAISWTQAERRLLTFVCGGLGGLRLVEATRLLASWLDAFDDPHVVLSAGFALAETRSPLAWEPLQRVRGRFGANSIVWERLSVEVRRVPEPTSDELGVAQQLARGQTRMTAGRLREALADFEAVVRRAPKHYGGWLHRGLARSKLGQHEAALKDFDRAIEIDAGAPHAWHARADTRDELRDHEGALADYAEALKRRDSPITRTNRALLYEKLGRLREARADYDAAIARAPGMPRARAARGTLRAKAGDHTGALEDYEVALTANPDDVTANFNRALSLAALKRWVDAISGFDRVLRLQPRNAAALVERGKARFNKGDLRGALTDLKSAARLAPDNVQAPSMEARVWEAAGDDRAALEAYGRAMRNARRGTPEYVGVPLRRAMALMRLGRIAEARTLLAQTLGRCEREDERGFVHLQLATVAFVGDQREAALRHIAEAVSRLPDDPKVYFTRGTIRAAMGDMEAAFADYALALKRDPRHGPTLRQRARTYIQLGKLAEAEADLTVVVAAEGAADALELRGDVRARRRSLQGAVDDYRAAVKRQPRRWRSWAAMAAVLDELGRKDAARKAVRQALEHAPPGARANVQALADRIG